MAIWLMSVVSFRPTYRGPVTDVTLVMGAESKTVSEKLD